MRDDDDDDDVGYLCRVDAKTFDNNKENLLYG